MLKSIIKPKTIVHFVAGIISGLFLVSDLFFSNKLNLWSVGETILSIALFYVYALVILPRLFKAKVKATFIGFSFGVFAIWAVLSSILKIASFLDNVYIFTRILNDGPAFGDSMEDLYEIKFLNAIALFAVSFIYGVLILNKTNKIGLLDNIVFDKKPNELLFHFIILFVISLTLYFAEILFSNFVFACFILFYIHLIGTLIILLKKKQLLTYLALTSIELLLFSIFLSHFTTIPLIFIISVGITILTISSGYALVRHQIKTNEFAFFKKDTELEHLKSQINPHFLFNALNTLYSFAIQENADKTASGIKKFSNLIRFTLTDIENDYIPLEKEINYIKDYVDIQLARCPIMHNVKINFSNFERYSIAPMLLIPIVENSFKHGINPLEESLLIVNLDCKAGTIFFECINSINKQNNNIIEKNGLSVGLKNIKSRLELIYPNNYNLEIYVEENQYKVILDINDKSYSN